MLRNNVELEPDRVYAICKMVVSNNYSKKELIEKMIINKDKRLKIVLNFTLDINLLRIDKGILKCKFTKKEVFNKDLFILKLSKIFLKNDEKFLKIIAELMKNYPNKYNEAQSYGSLLTKLPDSLIDDYDLKYIRVLRFWIDFFKLGYYINNQIVIYPLGRIKDIIRYSEFDKERLININEFIDFLKSEGIEFENQIDINNHKIKYILSLMLLELEKINYIKLKFVSDSDVVYKLTGEIIESKSKVSHVLIKGDL